MGDELVGSAGFGDAARVNRGIIDGAAEQFLEGDQAVAIDCPGR